MGVKVVGGEVGSGSPLSEESCLSLKLQRAKKTYCLPLYAVRLLSQYLLVLLYSMISDKPWHFLCLDFRGTCAPMLVLAMVDSNLRAGWW